MRSRAFALLAVAALALAVAAYRLNHDRALWNPDGAVYLRMALADRGVPPDRALRITNGYMLGATSEANEPQSRGFYGDAPPQYYRAQMPLFSTRPLYPALASLLLPRYGPFALKIVSALAYVAAVVLMYVLLLAFAPPWIAAAGAAALALTPSVLNHAVYPLTEMLALCFWIATLLALFAYLRAPSAPRLALLVVATALLSFTRPAVFLPFGAALAVLIAAPRGTALRAAAARATLAVAAVGVAFGIYTALAHGPWILTQLQWEYDWQHSVHGRFASGGLGSWWARSVAAALGTEVLLDAYKNNSLLVFVLAAFGALLAPRSPAVPVAAGTAAAALLIAIPVNPLEVVRTVAIPLAPVLLVLVTIALTALASSIAALKPLDKNGRSNAR